MVAVVMEWAVVGAMGESSARMGRADDDSDAVAGLAGESLCWNASIVAGTGDVCIFIDY